VIVVISLAVNHQIIKRWNPGQEAWTESPQRQILNQKLFYLWLF